MTLLQAHGVGLAAVGNLGHRLGGCRLQFHRPRQEVVRERSLDDLVDDGGRVQVRNEGRVEIRLGEDERHAQHLLLGGHGKGEARRGERREEEIASLPVSTPRAARSDAIDFQPILRRRNG